MSATAWTCPYYGVNLIAVVSYEKHLRAELDAILPPALPKGLKEHLIDRSATCSGFCTDFHWDGGAKKETLVFWVERHPWPRFCEYAAHETLHVTERVMTSVGMTLNQHTVEAFTYYQGKLLRKVMALRAQK